MKITDKKMLLVSLKMWIIGLFVNTLIGTYIVSGFSSQALKTAIVGLGYGFSFSFPVFIIILIMIYILLKIHLNFGNTFLILLIIGVLLAEGSFFFFSLYQKLSSTLNIPLAEAVATAAGIGIFSQYGAIKNLLNRRDHPDFFKHKIKAAT